MKTFIIHSPFLSDRNLNVDMLKSTFKNNAVSSNVSPDDITDEKLASIKYDKTGIPRYDASLSPLNKYHVSSAMNHIEAIRMAIDSKDSTDMCLFLEDDTLFDGNTYLTLLTESLKNFKESNFEIMFLNIQLNKDITTIQSINMDETIIPLTNAYVVKSSALEKLYNGVREFRYKFNVQLSFAIFTNKIQACVSPNYIFVDGSKFGTFYSYMDDNTILLLNPEWNGMYSALMRGTPENINVPLIEQKINELSNQNHPAVLHLHALLHMKYKQDYQMAKQYFEKAYDILVKNKFTVNGSVQLMKNYTSIFKYLQ